MDFLEARAFGLRVLGESSSTPALDCRILLCHALGIREEELYSKNRELAKAERRRFLQSLEKRASGLSVAVITGRKEFYGRTFAVSGDVLVPRPETEILVEKTISLVRFRAQGPEAAAGPPGGGAISPARPSAQSRRPQRISLLDVCCGTGCVGISIKAELERLGLGCDLVLGDISPAALEIARKNCGQILPDGAKCVLSDLFEAFGGQTYDFVTANPPYIALSSKASLPKEVLSEPWEALFSGEDGMDLTRRIIRESPSCLKAGGYLVLECGSGKAFAAKEILEASGFADCFVENDLGGLPRCVGGRFDA